MKRIRGVKPKLKQAKVLNKNGMNPDEWLIKKVYNDRLLCIKRKGGEEETVYFEVARI